MISQFASTDDGFVSCEDDVKKLVSLFRSSERQKIINFIIGSRIRDSGAELGPSTQLGKQIQRRVPLHSHARLEALYTRWVLYWRYSNYCHNSELKTIGTAKSFQQEVPNQTSSGKDQTDSQPSSPARKPPHILYRFLVGSFYQPLDAIEEYYGEKVAFYFAWLQHCSFHLLYLSVAGLVMFIIQITSGNWDHPLRPWFSILGKLFCFDSFSFHLLFFKLTCLHYASNDLVVCCHGDLASPEQFSCVPVGNAGLPGGGSCKTRIQGNKI